MKKLSTFSIGQATIFFLCVFFLVCMISNPSKYIQASLNGISAWAFCVLPSVLPFMFFTKVLSSTNGIEKISKPFYLISRKLFKTPSISIYVFLMAILSGYPVGTKMVADLYLQGKITKEDAFKMTSFCSTSGPMFIVGAVGISMFHSAKIGYILLASHVLSAIINGIIFRNFKLKNNEKMQKNAFQTQNFDLSEVVTNSTIAILSVGCIITIFFIVIECFSPIFNLFPTPISALLQGVVEITKGCISLSQISGKLSVCLTSFVISFGGISTILQSLTMLSKLQMPTKIFILQKILHGILSTIISFILISTI